MRGHRSEITVEDGPFFTDKFPDSVTVRIMNDPVARNEGPHERGKLFLRNTQEIKAVITLLQAQLPVVDQLGSIADG